jgi:TonB family protein
VKIVVKRIRSARLSRSVVKVFLSIAFVIIFSTGLRAQSAPDPNKSPEALQSRIERARALIAAHQLNTAASELESVRAATPDYAVRNITSVMLMGICLEEGNYARAEALLEENFAARSAKNDDSVRNYFALAGQAVNGARTHLARYRNLGINTADTTLPTEALNDLNHLRSLLERMIAQAKDISRERGAYDSLSLLEDVLGIRLSLAKDSEDQARWESEYAKAREVLASSQTQIASLGGVPPLRPGKSPANIAPSTSPYSTRRNPEPKAAEKTEATTEEQQHLAKPVSGSPPANSEPTPNVEPLKVDSPAEPTIRDVGSLNAKATRRVLPRYPAAAKQTGAAGLVRVHVIVDETGKVISVESSDGPRLLIQAAEDAARQWAFEAFSSDGKPARISGFIDFHFTL